MNKTKEAVREFLSGSGQHDTTVHDEVAPSVKHETVNPTQREEVNTAVNKEIHQDHYHHTVQPIHDREILPEQHKHNVEAVNHREFDHRDHEATRRAVEGEAKRLHDERVVNETVHTQTQAPVVHGERIHHHLHETIQPVVHKEVVQPTVVHTTVPVHEVHHNAALHHGTTELAPMSMADYEKKGGILGHGHTERNSNFDGCPKGTCEKGAGGIAGRTGTTSTAGQAGATGTAGTTGKSGVTGTGTSSQSFLPGGTRNEKALGTY